VRVDFVPLWDLIASVACFMSPDDDFRLRSLNATTGDNDASENEFVQAAMKTQRRKVFAAELLSRCLGSAPKELGPTWIEYVPPGDLCPTPNAHAEGLNLLRLFIAGTREEWASQERQLRQNSRWGTAPAFAYVPAMQRFREIGFERGDLICFLNERNVQHSLGELCPLAFMRQSRLASAPDFRDPLRDELREAWVLAIDKNDYKSIFKALVSLAKERAEDPESPLKGYSEAHQAVKYEYFDNTGKREIRTFNEEAMRGRMRNKMTDPH
jgi:hypothetical protein